MIQVLVLLHVLVSAALLGAITHQAFSVGRRPNPSSTFVDRYLGVNSPTFTNTVVLLFAVTALLGGLLYPRYRVDVRPTLEDLQLRAANGLFENQGALCRDWTRTAAGVLARLAGAAQAGVRRRTEVFDVDAGVHRLVELHRWGAAQQHQGTVSVSRYARFNVFSIVFGVAYLGFFFINQVWQWSLFGYYPVLHQFRHASLPVATAGPAITWYGWLLGAAVISLVVSFMTPRRLAERLGQDWVWTVPALVLIVTLVYERRWFY